MKKVRRKCALNVRRWVSYAAAGAAVTGAVASDAEAAFTYLYSGPVSQTVKTGSALGGPALAASHARVFSLSANGVRANHPFWSTLMTLRHAYNAGGGKASVQAFAYNQGFAGFVANGNNYASNLAVGGKVAAQHFGLKDSVGGIMLASGANGGNFQWGAGATGYLAFHFEGSGVVGAHDPFGPAGLNYGWVEVEDLGSKNGLAILAYGYSNDPSFEVGQTGPVLSGPNAVPEPASLGLLAIGATGLLALRRRRCGG